jgi:hypothetical protein
VIDNSRWYDTSCAHQLRDAVLRGESSCDTVSTPQRRELFRRISAVRYSAQLCVELGEQRCCVFPRGAAEQSCCERESTSARHAAQQGHGRRSRVAAVVRQVAPGVAQRVKQLADQRVAHLNLKEATHGMNTNEYGTKPIATQYDAP